MISARTSIIHHRGQPFFIIIHHKSVNIILKEKFFDSCFVKYLLMTAVQERFFKIICLLLQWLDSIGFR